MDHLGFDNHTFVPLNNDINKQYDPLDVEKLLKPIRLHNIDQLKQYILQYIPFLNTPHYYSPIISPYNVLSTQSPLQLSAISSPPNIIDYITSYTGFDLDCIFPSHANPSCYNILYTCAINGRYNIVKLLLRHGISLSSSSSQHPNILFALLDGYEPYHQSISTNTTLSSPLSSSSDSTSSSSPHHQWTYRNIELFRQSWSCITDVQQCLLNDTHDDHYNHPLYDIIQYILLVHPISLSIQNATNHTIFDILLLQLNKVDNSIPSNILLSIVDAIYRSLPSSIDISPPSPSLSLQESIQQLSVAISSLSSNCITQPMQFSHGIQSYPSSVYATAQQQPQPQPQPQPQQQQQTDNDTTTPHYTTPTISSHILDTFPHLEAFNFSPSHLSPSSSSSSSSAQSHHDDLTRLHILIEMYIFSTHSLSMKNLDHTSSIRDHESTVNNMISTSLLSSSSSSVSVAAPAQIETAIAATADDISSHLHFSSIRPDDSCHVDSTDILSKLLSIDQYIMECFTYINSLSLYMASYKTKEDIYDEYNTIYTYAVNLATTNQQKQQSNPLLSSSPMPPSTATTTIPTPTAYVDTLDDDADHSEILPPVQYPLPSLTSPSSPCFPFLVASHEYLSSSSLWSLMTHKDIIGTDIFSCLPQYTSQNCTNDDDESLYTAVLSYFTPSYRPPQPSTSSSSSSTAAKGSTLTPHNRILAVLSQQHMRVMSIITYIMNLCGIDPHSNVAPSHILSCPSFRHWYQQLSQRSQHTEAQYTLLRYITCQIHSISSSLPHNFLLPTLYDLLSLSIPPLSYNKHSPSTTKVPNLSHFLPASPSSPLVSIPHDPFSPLSQTTPRHPLQTYTPDTSCMIASIVMPWCSDVNRKLTLQVVQKQDISYTATKIALAFINEEKKYKDNTLSLSSSSSSFSTFSLEGGKAPFPCFGCLLQLDTPDHYCHNMLNTLYGRLYSDISSHKYKNDIHRAHGDTLTLKKRKMNHDGDDKQRDDKDRDKDKISTLYRACTVHKYIRDLLYSKLNNRSNHSSIPPDAILPTSASDPFTVGPLNSSLSLSSLGVSNRDIPLKTHEVIKGLSLRNPPAVSESASSTPQGQVRFTKHNIPTNSLTPSPYQAHVKSARPSPGVIPSHDSPGMVPSHDDGIPDNHTQLSDDISFRSTSFILPRNTSLLNQSRPVSSLSQPRPTSSLSSPPLRDVSPGLDPSNPPFLPTTIMDALTGSSQLDRGNMLFSSLYLSEYLVLIGNLFPHLSMGVLVDFSLSATLHDSLLNSPLCPQHDRSSQYDDKVGIIIESLFNIISDNTISIDTIPTIINDRIGPLSHNPTILEAIFVELSALLRLPTLESNMTTAHSTISFTNPINIDTRITLRPDMPKYYVPGDFKDCTSSLSINHPFRRHSAHSMPYPASLGTDPSKISPPICESATSVCSLLRHQVPSTYMPLTLIRDELYSRGDKVSSQAERVSTTEPLILFYYFYLYSKSSRTDVSCIYSLITLSYILCNLDSSSASAPSHLSYTGDVDGGHDNGGYHDTSKTTTDKIKKPSVYKNYHITRSIIQILQYYLHTKCAIPLYDIHGPLTYFEDDDDDDNNNTNNDNDSYHDSYNALDTTTYYTDIKDPNEPRMNMLRTLLDTITPTTTLASFFHSRCHDIGHSDFSGLFTFHNVPFLSWAVNQFDPHLTEAIIILSGTVHTNRYTSGHIASIDQPLPSSSSSHTSTTTDNNHTDYNNLNTAIGTTTTPSISTISTSVSGISTYSSPSNLAPSSSPPQYIYAHGVTRSNVYIHNILTYAFYCPLYNTIWHSYQDYNIQYDKYVEYLQYFRQLRVDYKTDRGLPLQRIRSQQHGQHNNNRNFPTLFDKKLIRDHKAFNYYLHSIIPYTIEYKYNDICDTVCILVYYSRILHFNEYYRSDQSYRLKQNYFENQYVEQERQRLEKKSQESCRVVPIPQIANPASSLCPFHPSPSKKNTAAKTTTTATPITTASPSIRHIKIPYTAGLYVEPYAALLYALHKSSSQITRNYILPTIQIPNMESLYIPNIASLYQTIPSSMIKSSDTSINNNNNCIICATNNKQLFSMSSPSSFDDTSVTDLFDSKQCDVPLFHSSTMLSGGIVSQKARDSFHQLCRMASFHQEHATPSSPKKKDFTLLRPKNKPSPSDKTEEPNDDFDITRIALYKLIYTIGSFSGLTFPDPTNSTFAR